MTSAAIMLCLKSQVATNKINDGFKIFRFAGKWPENDQNFSIVLWSRPYYSLCLMCEQP